MTMKNNFFSVNIVFLALSVKCVFGCTVNNGKLDCSTNKDKLRGINDIHLTHPHRVEVFDLSKNPLDEGLQNNSFTYFRNVRVLILRQDNLDSDSIEANAFSPLTKLTTLDLSENALTQVPCNLPSSLVHLDLGGNPIVDETGCGSVCLSLPSSLETLSLRGSKWRKRFPRFCESVPSIVELDVSKNSFDSVSVEDVAPLCGLQRINLTSVKISHPNGTCQKLQFEKWLTDHGVEIIGNITVINSNNVSCDATPSSEAVGVYQSCQARSARPLSGNPKVSCDSTPSSEAVEAYQSCRWKFYTQKYFWVAIGGGIFLLACVLVAVVLWWRKRKRLAKNLDSENSTNAMVDIENHELKDKTGEI